MAEQPSPHYDMASVSRPGRRSYNEDRVFTDQNAGLLIVADGVGGRAAGDVASRIVCDVVTRELANGQSLAAAIASAHREIIAAATRAEGKPGMASTIVVVKLRGWDYELAWVGDSRIYWWDGKLKLLTRDHSWVQQLYDSGEISLAEMDRHAERNIITQALGMDGDTPLDIGENRGRLGSGEVLLCCSDGLSSELASADIARILQTAGALNAMADILVKAAEDAGGRDNISVALVAGPRDNQANNAGNTEPMVVWEFDPASGEHKVAAAPLHAKPQVTRIAPRSKSVIPELHEVATPLFSNQTEGGSNWRSALLCMVLLLVAALAGWFV